MVSLLLLSFIFFFLNSFNQNTLEHVNHDPCSLDKAAGSAKFSLYQHIQWLILCQWNHGSASQADLFVFCSAFFHYLVVLLTSHCRLTSFLHQTGFMFGVILERKQGRNSEGIRVLLMQHYWTWPLIAHPSLQPSAKRWQNLAAPVPSVMFLASLLHKQVDLILSFDSRHFPAVTMGFTKYRFLLSLLFCVFARYFVQFTFSGWKPLAQLCSFLQVVLCFVSSRCFRLMGCRSCIGLMRSCLVYSSATEWKEKQSMELT